MIIIKLVKHAMYRLNIINKMDAVKTEFYTFSVKNRYFDL